MKFKKILILIKILAIVLIPGSLIFLTFVGSIAVINTKRKRERFILNGNKCLSLNN